MAPLLAQALRTIIPLSRLTPTEPMQASPYLTACSSPIGESLPSESHAIDRITRAYLHLILVLGKSVEKERQLDNIIHTRRKQHLVPVKVMNGKCRHSCSICGIPFRVSSTRYGRCSNGSMRICRPIESQSLSTWGASKSIKWANTAWT